MNLNCDDLSIRWAELGRALQEALRIQTLPQPTVAVARGLHHALVTNMVAGEAEILRLVSRYILASDRPLDAFLDLDMVMRSCNYVLGDFLSELGLRCHRRDGEAFFDAMQRCAEATGIATLHFLAAWSALNLDRFQDCIRECESIDDPFAAVYTLVGQAYLEAGQPRDAIDNFKIAVELNPNELLAWFMLAKSYAVAGENLSAWEAVERSRQLAPESEEIALLAIIIALDTGERGLMAKAWCHFKPMLDTCKSNGQAAAYLFDLAFRLEDRHIATCLSAAFEWKTILRQATFLKRISSILRECHARAWHEEALAILHSVEGRQAAAS